MERIGIKRNVEVEKMQVDEILMYRFGVLTVLNELNE